jgi:hypothetical protein
MFLQKLAVVAAVAVVGGMTLAPTATGAQDASARVRPCTNAELRASYHSTDAGAGHRYGRLVLKNVSGHACRTGGYGGLSYVGNGNGTQIGAAATRTRSRVRTIVVRPGQRVISVVDAKVAANYPKHRCRPAHVDGFRVYIPNETRSQYVVHATRGCRNHHVHLLAHKAFRRP